MTRYHLILCDGSIRSEHGSATEASLAAYWYPGSRVEPVDGDVDTMRDMVNELREREAEALFRQFMRAAEELKRDQARNPLLPRDFTLPRIEDEDD